MRATLVFRNGHLFDGRTPLPGHGLAVDGDRVLAVAPDADLDAYVVPGTEVVDLAGGLVLPGFQDAHVHPVQGGVERTRCDLTAAAETPAAYLAVVRAYAEANPDRPWVLGGGWAMPAFGPTGPTAAALDEVVADRPVFLPNRDHHGAWVNSLALRLAGVTRDTPDPVDGRIERDASGAPTGTLHEGAMALVQRRIPATTDGEHDVGLQVAQTYLHSLGVTAWQDAILGTYAGNGDPASAYLRAVEAGALTARVRGALWWERDRGLEQVEELLERRARFTRGRLSAGTVKVMQDGVVENYTAAMSRPYLDGHGVRDPQHRAVVRRPRAAARGGHPAGRGGLPGARARHRGPGGHRGAGRVRGRPRRERPLRRAAPRRAPAGGRARRPAAVRRARRDRERPGAVGGPRRRDDRDDAAVPRRGAGRLAVPVRLARRRRGAARGRQRLAGEQRPTRSPRSTSPSTGSTPTSPATRCCRRRR